MTRPAQRLRGFAGLVARLEADAVPFTRDPDRPELLLGEPEGAHVRLTWMFGRFQARFRLAATVPADRVPAVATTIARLNAGLALPGFELDAERGELAYRVVHLLERDQLAYGTLQDILTTIVQTARRHAGDLHAAAFPEEVRPDEPVTGEPPEPMTGETPWWVEDPGAR